MSPNSTPNPKGTKAQWDHNHLRTIYPGMVARIDSAPFHLHLLSHSWIIISLPRRKISRVVHLFICHQSGLVQIHPLDFLHSHCLGPLVYQSPLDQAKLLGFIQSGFIFSHCFLLYFCSHGSRLSWPSVTGSLRRRDPMLSTVGSLPLAPVIEDGCQNKAGGMNWHDEVRK